LVGDKKEDHKKVKEEMRGKIKHDYCPEE